MPDQTEFYQSHLDRVSRSFAFCIRQLPDPLRDWVALSYLLCRLVDTVEDSAWTDLPLQMEAFRRFDRALEGAESLSGWADLFPQGIPESEKLLVAEAQALMDD